MWGGLKETILPNDILRVIGIMSMDKNRDKTIALLNVTTKDSEVLDNPSYKPMVYFGEIAMDFNTFSLLFEPPANKHKIEGHEDLSANDHGRMDILRSGVWIKKVFWVGFPKYTTMNKAYRTGTGGGSGAPENYHDWQKRDDSYLSSYTPQRCICCCHFVYLFLNIH